MIYTHSSWGEAKLVGTGGNTSGILYRTHYDQRHSNMWKENHIWSFTVLELLNSRYEVDEGSIMFNPFSMLSLKILKRSSALFPSQILGASQEIAKKLLWASVLKSPRTQMTNSTGLFVNCDKIPDTSKGGRIYSVSEYQRLLFTIHGSIVPWPV